MSIINEALKKAERERRPLPVGLLHSRWEEKHETLAHKLFPIMGALCSSLLLVSAAYWYLSSPVSLPLGQTPQEEVPLLAEQGKETPVDGKQASPPSTKDSSLQYTDSHTRMPGTDFGRAKQDTGHATRSLKQPPPLTQVTQRAEQNANVPVATADQYFQEGVAFQENGNWLEAIEAFQKALALNDQLFSARNNLGNAYFHLGRYEEARQEYQAAILLNPSYAKAHNNLGNALVGLGELEEAVQVFQTAITLDPFYATPYYNLGALYVEMGERAKALAAFQKALNLNSAVKEWLQEDMKDYVSLQDDEEFQTLLR